MKDENCIFCKIISKEIQAEFVKETDLLIVFKDKFPKAPIHLLLVPKNHLTDITEADGVVWQEFRRVALELAKENKLKGFRLINNSGNAAQIKHMHVHFLGDIETERAI